MQKIFSFDSQLLNTFQACARKYEYSFVTSIGPPEKAEALERGDLMHRMLEIYYSLQIDEVYENLKSKSSVSEIFSDLFSAGLELPKSREFERIQKYSIDAGRFFGTRMSLDNEDITATIFQFQEYSLYYMRDSWRPMAVEEVGSKILFEDDENKIIYNFKIDLVAENGNIVAPFDHKTAKRRESPSSVSNQFIGYCYGLGLNNIIVNKIGFQKTLSPKERFNRFILTIDDERIKEWKENTIYWAFQMIHANETQRFPMNLTSCDKYSGCIFQKICESSPEAREWIIERDFKVNEIWDVAKKLEV